MELEAGATTVTWSVVVAQKLVQLCTAGRVNAKVPSTNPEAEATALVIAAALNEETKEAWKLQSTNSFLKATAPVSLTLIKILSAELEEQTNEQLWK